MENPPTRVREIVRLSSLATRSAALYSVLVGGAVLLAGWLIGAGHREGVLANRERDLVHRAETIQVRIETEIDAVANDVRFLAKAPFLRRLSDAWDAADPPGELLSEVEETFAALLAGKPSYAQSRFLDLSGQGNELIRIDQRGGGVVTVPRDELQPKGHRDYFRDSASLRAGEIYLSPINLNRELGQISVPHVPTLRGAAKVFDSAGSPFGLVVINIDLRELFAELQSAAGRDASLYIANADGDYLVHPDPGKTFGFDLGIRHRLSDTLGDDPVRAPQSDVEVIRFVRFSLPQGSGRELFIGVGTPRAEVLSELTRIRNRSLATALAAALVAAALVWVLAFLLSRRLTKLADAIGRYEPGGGSLALPVRGNDEIAVVARKFAALSAKIDEQVQALERARQIADDNRRAKEEFLATLSHEIRTPMNAVTGLVHALASDRPAEHQAANIGSLQFAARKLIAVVNDVLDFSKIEAGKLEFHRAPFDLHELLDGIQTGNIPQARDGGVDLVIERAEDVPRHLVGDSLRLYQILNNLVQNALKFTNPGGRVAVEIGSAPGGDTGSASVSFRVVDNGVGMDAGELERALSRYGQAQTGSAHKFGGTGLGLPIARMLVELQGGRFEARSTPGAGSEFEFELEFAAPPAHAGDLSEPARETPDLAGTRILCVEDVASNRQVVSALLDPTGTEVTFATDAAETLERLDRADGASELPDLILLDLQLPDRDGASLAEDIIRRWQQIPVIGLTAQTAGSLLERSKAAGIGTFLWKPIEPEQFFETVSSALGRAEGAAHVAGAAVDISPVDALFDGDREKADRYLQTLAGELEDAAAALQSLAASAELDGLRRIHHRLQNGLSLVGATAVIDSLTALLEGAEADAPETGSQIESSHQLLVSAAAQLRSALRPGGQLPPT